MTDPGTAVTYRYVSDGRMASALNRDAMTRARLPVAGLALAVVGFGLGLYASIDSNRDSWPEYRVEVVGIGLVWGLAFAVLWVGAGLVGLVVARGVNRRRMRRLYPTGSVTEVRLDQDALVLSRPTTTRTITYDRVRRVRRYEHTRWLVVRGRPIVEVLPASLLPDEAAETMQARAIGAVPLSWSTPATGPVQEMVVPDGWAGHVAGVTVRAIIGTSRFWLRLALAVLASAVVASAAGPAWLALGPAVGLLALTIAYARTRAVLAAAMPAGSVASVEALDDRIVSRTARWAREIRYDDVRSVDLRGDVVLLTMTSAPRRLALARDLLPESVVARLRAGATTPDVRG